MDWKREQELKERFKVDLKKRFEPHFKNKMHLHSNDYDEQLGKLALKMGYNEQVGRVAIIIRDRGIITGSEEGFLIATNARLFYLERIGSDSIWSITYDKVVAVKHKAGGQRYSGTITLITTEERIIVESLDKEHSLGLAQYVQACISDPAIQKSNKRSIADEIRRFYPDFDVFEDGFDSLVKGISSNESEGHVERVARRESRGNPWGERASLTMTYNNALAEIISAHSSHVIGDSFSGNPIRIERATRQEFCEILIATNARLVLMNNYRLEKDITYDKILSIKHEAKFLSRFSGKITVRTSETMSPEVVFDCLDKEPSRDLAEYVKVCSAKRAS